VNAAVTQLPSNSGRPITQSFSQSSTPGGHSIRYSAQISQFGLSKFGVPEFSEIKKNLKEKSLNHWPARPDLLYRD